jgi:hypothetical protein
VGACSTQTSPVKRGITKGFPKERTRKGSRQESSDMAGVRRWGQGGWKQSRQKGAWCPACLQKGEDVP